MDPKAILAQIESYLLGREVYKWSTSKGIINHLNLYGITPLELDDLLLGFYQETDGNSIRFSTLPSRKSLDVLWGHVDRVGKREVIDIYKEDDAQIVEGLSREISKSMFLSHSFRDSKLVLDLARDLASYGVHAWIAEVEILYRQHINYEVIQSISNLPYFGVFISQSLLASVWSAKEIEFALNNKKQIVGFLNGDIASYREEIPGGTRVSREIFSKFFDNHQDVTFVYYPEKTEELTDWELAHNFVPFQSLSHLGT